MKERKLDLFKFLSEMDKNNLKYYNSLSDEEKKEISSLVLMRWLSGAYNQGNHEYYCVMVNEVLNKDFFDLYEYQDLLFLLAASLGIGKTVKHQWFPMSKKQNNKIKDFIFKNSSYGSNDFKYYWESITEADIDEFLKDHNMTEKDFK